MPRIRFDMPDSFPFSTEIPVRITDINYGGHLGNDAALGVLHEARIQFLESMGYTEFDVEGSGIIMTEALVSYRAEVFRGDVLKVEIGVGEMEPRGCALFYRVTSIVSGKEALRARTLVAFFDYRARKVVPVPDGFARRFPPPPPPAEDP
jgi:acyl-CoA thioester hydrolase